MKPPTPKFIAIDPAYANNASGFAYRISGGWIHTDTFSSQDKRNIEDVLRKAQGISDPCTHMIIETAYLGKNPRTFARLTEAITRIKMVAESLDYTIVDVVAATWQSAMLTVSGYTPRKRADIKAQARWVAENVYKLRDPGEHEADAVCMLGYSDALGKQIKMAGAQPAERVDR